MLTLTSLVPQETSRDGWPARTGTANRAGTTWHNGQMPSLHATLERDARLTARIAR